MIEDKKEITLEELPEFNKIISIQWKFKSFKFAIPLVSTILNNSWISTKIEFKGLIDKFYIIGYKY